MEAFDHDHSESPRDSEISAASPVERAILRTVLYADVFDFPVTFSEIERYLDIPLPSAVVDRQVLTDTVRHSRSLETDDHFVYLAGRGEVVETRRRREQVAQNLWPRAQWYARLVWALPFVRFVAVTGALAVNSVEHDADIDFLLVTEPGRLWLARAMILVLDRLARRRGDRLCPNFLISTSALALNGRDLYAAHELIQMVPLHGRAVAEQLWASNQWCVMFLPNARLETPAAGDDLPRALPACKRLGERILRGRLGDRLERWERERKIARLRSEAGTETLYTADVCKGHRDGHAGRVRAEYRARVAAWGIGTRGQASGVRLTRSRS
jgi:hypothetical protein